jgi:hypothetical protein
MLDFAHRIHMSSFGGPSGRTWTVVVDADAAESFSGEGSREHAIERAFSRAEELRNGGNVLMVVDSAEGGETVGCVVAARVVPERLNPGPTTVYRGAIPSTVEHARVRENASRWNGARRFVARAAVLGAGALGLSALESNRPDTERRAPEGLSPAERRALYETTRHEAEAVCASSRWQGGLRNECAATATFLSNFPECDSECRAFVRSYRHRATR